MLMREAPLENLERPLKLILHAEMNVVNMSSTIKYSDIVEALSVLLRLSCQCQGAVSASVGWASDRYASCSQQVPS